MPQQPRLRPCRPPASPRSPSAPPADATSPPSHSLHGPSNGRRDENSSCAIALFIVVFELPCGRELHGIFLSPRAMLDLFRHGRARPGSSRPSTSFLPDCSEDVDARHNGPVLGPAKPDPSAGHDDSAGLPCGGG